MELKTTKANQIKVANNSLFMLIVKIKENGEFVAIKKLWTNLGIHVEP